MSLSAGDPTPPLTGWPPKLNTRRPPRPASAAASVAAMAAKRVAIDIISDTV